MTMKLIDLLSSLAVPFLVTCSPLINNGVRHVKRSPLMTGMAMANGGGQDAPVRSTNDSYSYWFGLGNQSGKACTCNVQGKQNYDCLQPTGGSWNWIKEFSCTETQDVMCNVPDLAAAEKVEPLCKNCHGTWTDVAVTR